MAKTGETKTTAGRVRACHDPEYLSKGMAEDVADYYAGYGERPGTAAGLEAFGVADGAEVNGELLRKILTLQHAQTGEKVRTLSSAEQGRLAKAVAAQEALREAKLGQRELTLDEKRALENAVKRAPNMFYDVCLTASKDVSCIVTWAPEEHSKELAHVVARANERVMNYVVREHCRVGKGKERRGGLERVRGGYVAVPHRVSRLQDPHLHFHNTVPNIVQRPSDGAVRALDAREIYRYISVFNQLLAAEIRREMVAMGYKFEGDGASIVGFQQQWRDENSRMMRMVEEAARERGIDLDVLSRVERNRLIRTLKEQIKPPKRTLSQAFYEEQKERAAGYGATPEALAELRTHARVHAMSVEQIGVHLAGEDGLTGVFARPHALAEFARMGDLGVHETEIAVDNWLAGQVRLMPDSVGRDRYATQLTVERQREILRAAKRSVGKGQKVSEVAIVRALNQVCATDEQQAMIRRFTQGQVGYDIGLSAAGTGKTSVVLRATREAYEGDRRFVYGAATDAIAAQAMVEKAAFSEENCRTVAHWVEKMRHTDWRPTKDSVLLVDEIGKVSTADMYRLMEAFGEIKAVGDVWQTQSVEAGGFGKSWADTVSAVELIESHRQVDRDWRKAISYARHGKFQLLTAHLEQHGRLQRVQDHSQTVDLWAQKVAENALGGVWVGVRSNAERVELADHLRERGQQQGWFGIAMRFGDVIVAEGEPLICRHNDRQIGVLNGTSGAVKRVTDRFVEIELGAGATRKLPAAYVQEHGQSGLARTVQSMQGGEAAVVIGAFRPEDVGRTWLYTLASRATHEFHVHAIDDTRESAMDEVQSAPGRLERSAAQYHKHFVQCVSRDDREEIASEMTVDEEHGRALTVDWELAR